MEVAMKTKLVAFIVTVIFCASYSSGNDGQVARKGIRDSTSTASGDRSAPAAITTGVAVSVMIGEAGGASVYFPIIAGRRFRIEPELGLFASPNSNRLGIQENQYTATWEKLGVGLFYVFPLGAYSNAYFGPRIARVATGYLFSDEVGELPERKGYLIAPSGGLELGSSHFTFSLELQLDYIRVKCYNDLVYDDGRHPPAPSAGVVTRAGFAIGVQMSLHWYF